MFFYLKNREAINWILDVWESRKLWFEKNIKLIFSPQYLLFYYFLMYFYPKAFLFYVFYHLFMRYSRPFGVNPISHNVFVCLQRRQFCRFEPRFGVYLPCSPPLCESNFAPSMFCSRKWSLEALAALDSRASNGNDKGGVGNDRVGAAMTKVGGKWARVIFWFS